MKIFRPYLLALVAVVAAGCSSNEKRDDDCREAREYQSSNSIPPFQVPDGLDAPESPQRFAVPEVNGAAESPVPGPCLERPPNFFNQPIGKQADKRPDSAPAASPPAAPAAPAPPP